MSNNNLIVSNHTTTITHANLCSIHIYILSYMEHHQDRVEPSPAETGQ